MSDSFTDVLDSRFWVLLLGDCLGQFASAGLVETGAGLVVNTTFETFYTLKAHRAGR